MSTVGKGATNLVTSQQKGITAHVAGTDEFSSDPKVNPFQNVAWTRTLNMLEEEIVYSPVTVQMGYNGIEHVFELQKNGAYQGAFYLMFKRSQVAWQGGDGSYARFHDFEGYASIDKVVYNYMNKDVVITSGEDMYWEMKNNRDTKFQGLKKREQNGDSHIQSVMAEKLADNGTGRWIFVDLLSPFEKLRKQLPVIGFPSKVKIKVYFKPLQQCLVTDHTVGNPNVTINEMYLYTNCTHFPPQILNAIFDTAKNTGYALMVNTHEFENDNLFIASSTAAEQTWTVDIRNIKNFVFEMKIFIRPIRAVKPAGWAENKYLDLWESLIIPCQWWLEDQGSEVTKKYEGRVEYGSRGMKDHYFAHKNAIQFIPSMFFTINTQYASTTEASEDNSYGGRQMNRYTNLKLKLHFKANTKAAIVAGEQYHVNVAGRIHNQILLTKGDLRRYLL